MRTAIWMLVVAAGVCLAGWMWAQGPEIDPPAGPPPQEGPGPGFEGPPEIDPPHMLGELVQLMEQAREGRQDLLDDLKQVLEQNRDATREERRAAVDAWREANADLIEEQRELALQLRLRIREWVRANRPVPPEDGEEPEDEGELSEEQYQMLMAEIRNRHQDRIRAGEALGEQLRNAGSAEERRGIVDQFREQRMGQVQERRQEWQARAVQLDREESIAALRLQLRENADQLRARNRLQDREEAIQARERATLRDRQERPDRPDRPEPPERPDRPDRPDRFNDGAVPGPAESGVNRREQLMERQAP